jgi:hypothetical protein
MKLRFPGSKIQHYAERYSYTRNETELLALHDDVQRSGYLTKPQLQLLAKWKSPRSAPNVEKNMDSYIQEISRFALHTTDERARIEALTLLDGVLWPTASVVLHVFHVEPYPIMDIRALWSVGVDVPAQYTFAFWLPYVEYCRGLAQKSSVTMRVLDRALWQYSKENQPKRAPPPNQAPDDD